MPMRTIFNDKKPLFFWLHIKKSAGRSTRRHLAPYYKDVERVHKPFTFVQAQFDEYNAVLNNFRIPLGDYQFRRSLFAKKFLYKNNWEEIHRFAFSREPVSRCLSAFFYLQRQNGFEQPFLGYSHANITCSDDSSDTYKFDFFLDLIEASLTSSSIYTPVNLHFTTHTAPMWGDIVDENDVILLSHVYRLEAYESAINYVLELCGSKKRIDGSEEIMNQNKNKYIFQPNSAQKVKIEHLYRKDFEIYELALGG